jgi:catechol 2,3-dioxygenase-like lactoylglutathione lyase family enzyme
MIDHFGIQCADLAASAAFYDATLAPLGFARQMDFGVAIGYEDTAAPANACRTTREPTSANVTFVD